MKDITHYFQTPLAENTRAAGAERPQCFNAPTETNCNIDKKCIKSVENALTGKVKNVESNELKNIEPNTIEEEASGVANKMSKKRRRRGDSQFSHKAKMLPPEEFATNNEKCNGETKTLKTCKMLVNIDGQADKTLSADKCQSTNAFLILMSPKTPKQSASFNVSESSMDADEIALTLVKENISMNSSGKLKLSTRSKKRRQRQDLEDDCKRKIKKIKHDQELKPKGKGNESQSDLDDDQNNSNKANKKNILCTNNEIDSDVDPKMKAKKKVKKPAVKECSKEKKNIAPDSVKKRIEHSNDEATVNDEAISSEELNDHKHESNLTENKQKRNKLSLRTKSTSALLRKHLSPENSHHLPSEAHMVVKTPNSLFNYFNRINSDEPEKIEVKALVHSTPVSPSVNGKTTVFSSNHCHMENQSVNGMLSPANRAGWKLRVKLRTKEEEDEIIVVKEGRSVVKMYSQRASALLDKEDTSSSDDHIFTPQKNRAFRKTSMQQQVASMVVKKAVVLLSRIKDPAAPLSINKAAASTNKPISPNKQKAVVNLAPLFTRVNSRRKVDVEVVEARKKFLKSGVPEQVKRILNIQRSMEEQEHYAFPTVAHIQQKEDNLMWNLPAIALSVKPDEAPTQLMKVLKLGEFSQTSALQPEQELLSETITHESYKTFLQGIKADYPEFPVYRTFKKLRTKASTQLNNTDAVPKAERRQRRSKRKKKACEEANVGLEPLGVHKMWTEKYKPLSGQEVVGNGYSVGRLQKWLETWKRYSEEVHRRSATSAKKGKQDECSGDEFVDSDSGVSETCSLPDNTVILVGPYGSGKTCAVYAIANELGFKVLEINSSSKRNGKRILSELQEATQSHQVQAKGDHPGASLNSYFKKGAKNTDNSLKKSRSKFDAETEEDGTSSRMSLILVEGVEVVYEDHDEGFISALNTLVASSKRPVILVTSDPHCAHISRFMDQHIVLKFRQPPVKSLSVWLQLVCLLEGLSVSRVEIERLIDLNNGDVRRTMLQLQFWVLSGGDRIGNTSINPLPIVTTHSLPVLENDEEQSNMSWDSAPHEMHILENSNVVRTFIDGQLTINGVPLVYASDLDHIWWNFAPLLSLAEVQMDRLNNVNDLQTEDTVDMLSQEETEMKPILEKSLDVPESTKEEAVMMQQIQVKKCSWKEVDAMAALMDTFSQVDVLSHKNKLNIEEGIWSQPPKDGLSLHQDLKLSHWHTESTSHGICNFLLEQGLEACRSKINSERVCKFKLTRPSQQDLNWQVEQHACNRAVLPAVPLWNHPQHRAVCIDYLPVLRTVIRDEKARHTTNTKRGNRFFHYLKGLNVHASDATFHSLSRVFMAKH